MSRSVIIPISRSPSITGIEPASTLSMNDAASCTGWSGRTVCTSRVITSLTFMVPLLSGIRLENEPAPKALRLLRHVLGQKVVGRDQLGLLIEHLNRPAHLAGVLRLDRLGSDAELHADRIARIERCQEAQILEARVGQHRARIGIDEQAGGEAQDQIAVRHAAFEDWRSSSRFLVHVGVELVARELGK